MSKDWNDEDKPKSKIVLIEAWAIGLIVAGSICSAAYNKCANSDWCADAVDTYILSNIR